VLNSERKLSKPIQCIVTKSPVLPGFFVSAGMPFIF
jgi:hypothetical protein